jgi:hypothetical protein
LSRPCHQHELETIVEGPGQALGEPAEH